MNTLLVIGKEDPALSYTDRPTVKVIIRNALGEALILNDGLLPGGGIEYGETDDAALRREIIEECGMTLKNISEIGTVIQYRDYLKKRYVIHGYLAALNEKTIETRPQDAGENDFRLHWLSIDRAIAATEESITHLQSQNIHDDSHQGALYNRLTTLTLLHTLTHS